MPRASCLLTSLLSGARAVAPPPPPPAFLCGGGAREHRHVAGCGSGSVLCCCGTVLRRVDTSAAFILLLMDGHFGCSCCLAVVDEAATHNPVCISLWTYAVLLLGVLGRRLNRVAGVCDYPASADTDRPFSEAAGTQLAGGTVRERPAAASFHPSPRPRESRARCLSPVAPASGRQ